MKTTNHLFKYKTFFCCLFISIISISCSDSEDISSTESLLTNAWDVVKFQSKLPNETEWVDSNNNCVNDDTWDFSNSGVLTIYSGAVLCDGDSNANNTVYGFKLAVKDTKIIFIINGAEYEEDIEELTTNTLITTYARGTTDNSLGRRIFTRVE